LTPKQKVVDFALKYADAGIPVFPCRKDKRPHTQHGFKDATTDPDQVRKFWGKWPDAMIGMPTGKASGYDVVDVDKDGSLPMRQPKGAPKVRTPSGGFHLYFPASGLRNSEDKGGTNVDVRGDGGYVILPPSANGKGAYRWVGRAHLNGKTPGMPSELREWLSKRRRRNSASKPTEAVRSDVRGHDKAANGRRMPEIGRRHPELVSLCVRLIAEGATRELLEEGLRAEAKIIKLPKREDDEVGRLIEWAWSSKASRAVRVARKEEQLSIDHEARTNFEATLAGDQIIVPDGLVTMGDEFDLPEEDEVYAIEKLHPEGGNTQLSAVRKSGKTSLALTLTKALADGEHFLGGFECDLPEDCRVGYLNYELRPAMFRRWLRKTGIEHPEHVAALHLRGRSLPFWLPEARATLVEWCKRHAVAWLIIDPRAAAGRGLILDENNNAQVGEFNYAIDVVKEQAGVENALVVHHAGKDQLRNTGEAMSGRGASRAEDWPDVLWTLTYDEIRGPRFLEAGGRDAALDDPIELVFDRNTGLYRYGGKSKDESRASVGAKKVIEAVRMAQALPETKKDGQGRPNSTEVKKQMKGRNDKKTKLIALAEEEDFIRRYFEDGRPHDPNEDSGTTALYCEVTPAGGELVPTVIRLGT